MAAMNKHGHFLTNADISSKMITQNWLLLIIRYKIRMNKLSCGRLLKMLKAFYACIANNTFKSKILLWVACVR